MKGVPSSLLWVIFLALLGVTCLAYLKFQNPLKVPVIRETRLADVEDADCRAAFVCPDGSSYSLLIATPKRFDMPKGITGKLRLFENQTNILDLSLDSEYRAHCTWLTKYGLDAWIIENPTVANARELNSYLVAGRSYELMVTNAPVGSSIWLVHRRASGW